MITFRILLLIPFGFCAAFFFKYMCQAITHPNVELGIFNKEVLKQIGIAAAFGYSALVIFMAVIF